MNLLSLPDEIVDLIIYFLTQGRYDASSKNPLKSIPYLFNGGKEFLYLLPLSSTCTQLRIKLAPLFFSYISLIRQNEVDAILGSPGSMSSRNHLELERMLLREVLDLNYIECAKGELARSSFKHGFNEYQHDSRYSQTLALSNFTRVLECSNGVLANSILQRFQNLHGLKILDAGLTKPTPCCLPNLKYLSVNICTLVNAEGMVNVLKQVERLDLMCQFSQIKANTCFDQLTAMLKEVENARLTQLNIFFTNIRFFAYKVVADFLECIPTSFPCLESLNFRPGYSSPADDAELWTLLPKDGADCDIVRFLYLVKRLLKLKQLGLDYRIIPAINLSVNAEVMKEVEQTKRKKGLVLTVCDKDAINGLSFTATGTIPTRTISVALVMMTIGATVLNHHYFRPQELNYCYKHVHAQFRSMVEKRLRPKIHTINFEQSWSGEEEVELVNYLMAQHGILQDPTKSDQQRAKAKRLLDEASVFTYPKRLFPNPTYRSRETYQVVYKDSTEFEFQRRKVHENAKMYDTSSAFWEVQSSFKEWMTYSNGQGV